MRQQLNKLGLFGCLILGLSAYSQEGKQDLSGTPLENKKEVAAKPIDTKKVIEAQNLTYKGNESLSNNAFVAAEKSYRTAIGINPEDATPAYNLGSALYQKEAFEEALTPLKKAVIAGKNKQEKHTALHNLGNTFMKNKSYEKAVETYKEALRNEPTDNETRYNLAIAKEMLKKEKQELKIRTRTIKIKKTKIKKTRKTKKIKTIKTRKGIRKKIQTAILIKETVKKKTKIPHQKTLKKKNRKKGMVKIKKKPLKNPKKTKGNQRNAKVSYPHNKFKTC